LVQGVWSGDHEQNTRECITAVLVLKRLARNRQAWGKRVLLITDSLVTLGVLSKGRSSSFPLLRLARQAAAYQLVCQIRPYLRWIPSSLNWADGPSRGEKMGLALMTLKKVHERDVLMRGALRRLKLTSSL